ncbi:MAG: potassium transporter Trk [Epulopiscium sp. Nuni2H_MBin001]|nr:MAG: potassium transporter Trk [Epulopiscium sp. Nuni2H_MBin001]
MRSKQFVICGIGRFGRSLAVELAEGGYEVMVVDQSEERIQEISSIVTHAVQADTTDVDIMKSLGIRNFDVAIVSIGKDIQSSIMTTLLLKELGIPYVIAKAKSELHERVLRKIGADRVIQPELEMGRRIATNLISGNILEHIQLSSEYSIIEIPILNEWKNKSIVQIDLRNKYGINVIAIQRQGKIEISPRPDFVFMEGDVLIVVGSNIRLKTLEGKRYSR